jgi:hypothetical protein
VEQFTRCCTRTMTDCPLGPAQDRHVGMHEHGYQHVRIPMAIAMMMDGERPSHMGHGPWKRRCCVRVRSVESRRCAESCAVLLLVSAFGSPTHSASSQWKRSPALLDALVCCCASLLFYSSVLCLQVSYIFGRRPG